jgi:hypothetical protein
MRDKMRKKYQRGLNQKIRELNRAIQRDELWRGRFEARQISGDWYKFHDGSGGMLWTTIRMVDKKTGYYKDYQLDYFPNRATMNWQISMEIANAFIVEDLDVWSNDDPKNDDINYNKIKISDVAFDINKYEWNYNCSYYDKYTDSFYDNMIKEIK